MRLAVAALAMILAAAPGAFAQEDVDVETSVLDGSMLIKFTNTADSAIGSFVVWFTSEHVFQSATSDPGWSVVRDRGIVHLMGNLEPDQAVRLGVKFQGEDIQMAWSANFEDGQTQTGWVVSGLQDASTSAGPQTGILPESTFRTIPEKPSAGSTIRLVGSGFGPSQELFLSVESVDLGRLATGDTGAFVATRTMPGNLDGRVVFALADSSGNDIQISLRLNQTPRPAAAANALSIDGMDGTYGHGDILDISGTAKPLSTVTFTLYGPRNQTMTTVPVEVDYSGVWELDDLFVREGAALGTYRALVNDGYRAVESSWIVESGKVIVVEGARSIFDRGDPLRFVVTAKPDTNIELMLLDPDGNELTLDRIYVDESASVEWEYATDTSFRRGTYTLIATQGDEQEFAYVGLERAVEIPVNIAFDKINYISSDDAKITIASKPGDDVTLLVLNPADTVVYQEIIHLGNDGRAVHDLDLGDFQSGVYTAIAKKNTIQTQHRFGVGLSTGASTLDINTGLTAAPGEPILVLGNTNPNMIVMLTLSAPDGSVAQTVNTFSDRTGTFSEKRLRMPLDAEPGGWTVRATSGSASSTSEIRVSSGIADGLAVIVDESGESPLIRITGATYTYVTVTIMDADETVASERAYVTDDGVGELPWRIEVSGTYTIIVEDLGNTAQTTYRYNPR